MIISENIYKIFDLKTVTLLETINPDSFKKGVELAETNSRLGFREEYLQLCLIYYYREDELKPIHFTEGINNLIKIIEKVKFIEENPKKFKTEWGKIFFSKVVDFRLIIALFADKLKCISLHSEDQKLVKIIDELYVPLSHVIGINYYTAQFEDYVIRTKYAKEYAELLKKAKKHLLRDVSEIDNLVEILEAFRKHPSEKIYGRIKSPYSVFKKVYVRNEPLENINDYVAMRIITKTEENCYSWLGYIFSLWQPVIGKIKDYIEHPKPNGYKSLHATVITELGPVEFQVRTESMHEFAEYGFAAHWRYKKQTDFGISERLLNKSADDKFSFGREKIFVYTPNGDIVILDKGCCVLDFAYAIHTDLGNHAVRALVNNIPATLYDKLNDNDVISIFVDKNKKPSLDSLEFVKSKKAIDKIKQVLGIVSKSKITRTEDNKQTAKIILESSVAKCCNPFYDEEIALYKTSKRKYIIHTIDCLLRKKMNYINAPKGINKRLLVKRLNLQIDCKHLDQIVNTLKRTVQFEAIRIEDNKQVILLDIKCESREDCEKTKARLLNIDGILKVVLI